MSDMVSGMQKSSSITLDGTGAPTTGLHVRSGVAEFVPDVSKHFRDPDITVVMSMDAWAAYFVGDITLDALLAREDVEASDKGRVKGFFGLFDQVHPSKAALISASALEQMSKEDRAKRGPESSEDFILTDAPFPVIDDA